MPGQDLENRWHETSAILVESAVEGLDLTTAGNDLESGQMRLPLYHGIRSPTLAVRPRCHRNAQRFRAPTACLHKLWLMLLRKWSDE